jgi:hypothetical protein
MHEGSDLIDLIFHVPYVRTSTGFNISYPPCHSSAGHVLAFYIGGTGSFHGQLTWDL